MKTIALLIGGVVLANVVWATFFWKEPAKATAKPEPIVNSATAQGQEPWMVNERYNGTGRDIARKSVLETLDKPWAEFCTTDGRMRLLESIGYYFGQRSAQIQSYERTYGEAAKRYAIKSWTTPEDNRIERMVRETFGRGYFSLDELRPYIRTPVAELVKGERAHAKPCATASAASSRSAAATTSTGAA